MVVGPEGSGTHMLTDIVTALGGKPEHRSLPHAGRWWDASEFPTAALYLVIIRDPAATARSVVRRGLARDEAQALAQRTMAINALARLPDATWWSYDAFLAEPRVQIEAVARVLGLPVPYDTTGWVRR